MVNNPEKSKVIGKVAYARWPKGPSGKRVTSIWNWGFPINAALTEKRKKATWLFIQWAASAETQARTAHRFAGPTKRSGVNRTSIWRDPDYVKLMNGFGNNFVEATMQACKATPMSIGVRGCRNGPRSATPWRRRSSRRSPVRPPSRPRSTTRSAASNR